MKILLLSLFVGISLSKPLVCSSEVDLRFVHELNNAYFTELRDVVKQAFSRRDLALSSFLDAHSFGDTRLVTFSFALDDIPEPITEKDFERLKGYFDPFIDKQLQVLKEGGKHITSRHASFPLPKYAEGYNPEILPTMVYEIMGAENVLFYMMITFSDRTDNHLVISFVIGTVK